MTECIKIYVIMSPKVVNPYLFTYYQTFDFFLAYYSKKL